MGDKEREIKVEDIVAKMKYEIWMEGVNMTDEYQGVWIRYKKVEAIIDKYKKELL